MIKVERETRQMKIMLIQPGSFSPEEVKAREDYAKSVCSPDTTVIMASVAEPPIAPTHFPLFEVLVPGVLERVKEAEKEGCDGVVIDCFTDVGLEAAKTIANMPVIGPFESSLHIACLLADKFGLIIPKEEGIPSCFRLARAHGMADRIASIKALDIPFLLFRDKKDEVEAKLTKLVQESVGEGAQLIIIGCTALFPALGIGSVEKLSSKLGIALIDTIGLSLKLAEMLVRLNLRQSKLAFPNLR